MTFPGVSEEWQKRFAMHDTHAWRLQVCHELQVAAIKGSGVDLEWSQERKQAFVESEVGHTQPTPLLRVILQSPALAPRHAPLTSHPLPLTTDIIHLAGELILRHQHSAA